MTLSRRYTAWSFYAEAMRDIQTNQEVPDFEKFNLINRAVEAVVGEFYALMANDYMTPVVVVPDRTGKYSTAMGNFYIISNELSIAMNTGFASLDIGKLIVFRSGTDVYVGFISAVQTTSTVRVTGYDMPLTDMGVDSCTVASTMLSTDVISLAGLPIMRTGQQVRMILESSSLPNRVCTPVTVEELNMFRTSNRHNLNKIIFAYSGDELLLRWGDLITSLGIMIFRYPRIPTPVSSDTDYVDIPDSTPISIAILYLRKLLAQRLKVEIKPVESEMASLVQNLLQSYGVTSKLEEVRKKVEALS